mgnify:CR=1 FL=1
MIDTRDSSLFGTRNPMEGEVRIPSGCAIAGIFHKKGGKIGGDTIIRAMEPMHDRSNGLGGGFAGYGIYPDLRTAMPSICSTTMSPRGMTASIT